MTLTTSDCEKWKICHSPIFFFRTVMEKERNPDCHTVSRLKELSRDAPRSVSAGLMHGSLFAAKTDALKMCD